MYFEQGEHQVSTAADKIKANAERLRAKAPAASSTDDTAAPRATAPIAPPATVRQKHVRRTVDLSPAAHRALDAWQSQAAGRLGHPIDLPYLGFPALGQMQFTLGMLLIGDGVAALLHFGYGLLAWPSRLAKSRRRTASPVRTRRLGEYTANGAAGSRQFRWSPKTV